MVSKASEKSLGELQQKRQALTGAWATAVLEVCGDPGRAGEILDMLQRCVDDIIDAFRRDSDALQLGLNVGRSLASMVCKRPEILGYTALVLSDYFLASLADAQKQAARQFLASLLGGISHGFLAEMGAVEQTVTDQLEAARRAERRYYTTVLDMIDTLIVVVDAAGHFVGFNGAAERVSGYTFDEIYGRHYTFLQTPDSHAKIAHLLGRLTKTPPDRRSSLGLQSIWVTRDGERREIDWSVTAVYDQDNALTFVIGTGTDVTAGRQIEKELAEAQRQLAQAKEAERLRLARDLHDGAVQQLLGISYQLAEMQGRALEEGVWTPAQRLEELAPGLEYMRDEVVGVAQGLRRLISSLRPPALHETGLAEILAIYVENWQQNVGRDGPPVHLDMAMAEGERLPEAVATCIFRLVQEGIWNAYKHAGASAIKVSLRRSDERIVVRIQDNGRGFTIPQHLFQFATAGRFGFVGMQERVQAVDGILSVWSEPGRGTEVQAVIPLQNES